MVITALFVFSREAVGQDAIRRLFALLNDFRLRAELLLKLRKAVAVVAHEVRAPLPVVARVALHRSHVGAVRIRFYVGGLLRERLVTPAVAGDALFLRGIPPDACLRVFLGERLCRGTGCLLYTSDAADD